MARKQVLFLSILTASTALVSTMSVYAQDMSREEQIFMELIEEDRKQRSMDGKRPANQNVPMPNQGSVSIPVNQLPTAEGLPAKQAQQPTAKALRQEFNQLNSQIQEIIPQTEQAEAQPSQEPLIAMPTVGSEESLDTEFVPDIKDVENRGVLTIENGGFTPDVWKGVTRKRAEELLERLKENGVRSVAGRRLVERLLLTESDAPLGKGNLNWLSARVSALQSIGLVESSYALLQGFKGDGLKAYSGLSEVWTEGMLMAGQADEACAFVRKQVLEAENAFWRRALLTCQALQGDAGLYLSLELLPENERKNDPVLYKLLDAVKEQADGPRLAPDVRITPLHAAIYSVYSYMITPDVVLKLPDVVLRKVMRDEQVDVSLRLQAAEKLVNDAGNQADVHTLGKLYDSVEYDLAVLQSPLDSAKEMLDGSKARALLWQAAGAAELPSARALVLRELWERSETDGLINLPASMTPDMRNIEPERNLTWFAPHVIRSALRGGNVGVARDWWKVLSQKRKLQRDLALEKADLSIAFGVIGGVMDNKTLETWWESQPLESDADKQEAQRVLSIVEASDLPVPTDMWLKLHEQFSDANINQGKGPGALWLRILGTALEKNQTGEALLLLVEPMLYAHPVEMAPQSLANVVTGLRYLGLDDESKAVAMEALMHKGNLIY